MSKNKLPKGKFSYYLDHPHEHISKPIKSKFYQDWVDSSVKRRQWLNSMTWSSEIFIFMSAISFGLCIYLILLHFNIL